MRSTRTRLGAAITAGVALSAIGVLSLTSGTVAELSDSIEVRAEVGVAGVPYGVARTVSMGFTYERKSGGRTTRDRSATLDSRSDLRNDAPLENLKPFSYPESGIRLNRGVNERGCVSSNRAGNTDRCPNTAVNSIVSASTGREPGAIKFDLDFWDENLGGSNARLLVHDIETSVSCHENGTVEAGRPFAHYLVGSTGTIAGHVNSGFVPAPGDNKYKRTRQWLRTVDNRAVTIEMHTIRQTFTNPPRALSAIVVYATSSNARNGGGEIGDFAFVSKSECAVTPDGSVTLDPSTTFGDLLPTTRTLETPGWNGDYTQTIEGDLSAARAASFGPADTMRSLSVPTADETMALTEPSNALTIATTSASVTTPSSASSTRSNAPDVMRSTERAASTAVSATPRRGSTPTIFPEPPSIEATTKSSAQPGYRRAGDGTLNKSEKALVEEAIAAAATADSGDLPGGASYAVTADQLDGTTLIVTTASGRTLRIVWEK